MKPLRALILSGFFLNLPAFGYLQTPEAACSPVDLRSQFLLHMRNQRGISWCYAHAAADYLQYIYRLPEQISAADIAIHYADSDLSKIITFFKRLTSREARLEPPQTGFIEKAVKRSIQSGYCPEWALPSEQWTRVDRGGRREKVDLIRAILEMYSLQKDIKRGMHPTPESLPFHYEFEHMDRAGFHSILKSSSRKTLLSEVRSATCSRERRPYPILPVKTSFRLRGRKVFQRINSQLSSRIPVSIDFFSGVLGQLEGARKKTEDLHTVLLYGRRYDAEARECVYLMKNSYGEDCSIYDPKIRCEAGYLWLPEGKLHPYLTSLLFLTRQ